MKPKENETMTNFADIAANLVAAAGFTPCPHSAFETADKVFAFSDSSANGKSWSGPAFEVVIIKETGKTFTTNSKTHENLDFFSVES